MIRAVFFDMGGTIETFGFTPELRIRATAGIQKILQSVGIELNLSDVALYTVVTQGLKQYHDSCIDSLVELSPVQVWSDYVLRDFNVDRTRLESVAEQLATYVELSYYERKMRPEIPAVLEELRRMGLKIGLISNVNSRGQVPANLKQYRIDEYFDPIIMSSEYGRRKPDPAIFHYAARLMNVPASQCAYIGDRINRDIVGARKAGFRLAIQIIHDYEHGELECGATPDAVVNSMTEILTPLREEMSRSFPRANHPIQALIFDAGDILYHRPQKGSRFDEFVHSHGIEPPHGFLERQDELVQMCYRGQISQEVFRESILELYGITDEALRENGRKMLEEDDNGVVFFEGVRETLEILKQQGFLLGIITDTANSISTKLSWFEKAGIGHVWDSIISSQEVGVRKPDPNIYRAALQQLGVAPEQAVFIGHKKTELDGAHAVGMKTIALNFEAGAAADVFINHFHDLLSVPLLVMHPKLTRETEAS